MQGSPWQYRQLDTLSFILRALDNTLIEQSRHSLQTITRGVYFFKIINF